MTSAVAPAWVRALAERKRKRLSKPSFDDVWNGLLHTSFFQGAMRWDESNPLLTPRAQHAGQALRKRVESGKPSKPFHEDLEGASFTLLRSLIKGGKTRGMWSAERVEMLLAWWSHEASPAAAVRCLVTALSVQFWTGDAHTSPRPFGLLFDQPARALTEEEVVALREFAHAFPGDVELLAAMRTLPSSTLHAELTRDAAEAAHWVRTGKPEEALELASVVDDITLARGLVPHLIVQERSDELLRVVLRWGDALRELVLVPALATWKGEHAAAILACLPSEQAASLLVESLSIKTQRKAAGEALTSMPTYAVPALKTALRTRSKHAVILEALLANLEAMDAPREVAHEAPVDALPEVLKSPPWTNVETRVLEARALAPRYDGASAAERATASARIAEHRVRAEDANIARLLRIGDLEIAPFAADWYARASTRHDALAWVSRFPEHAAEALVVETMRGDAQARALLTAMWARPARKLIARVARHHGVTHALLKVLEHPPLPKALPDGLEALPRVSLATGQALSAEAQTVLLQLLSALPVEGDRSIAMALKESFEGASCEALCIALTKRWVAHGMLVSERWMLHATALLGGDEALRFLCDQSIKWATDGSERSARIGLFVVAMHGSDIALSLLSGLAQSKRKQWLKDEAALLLQEVADARALTLDALEDERRIDPKALTSAERTRALADATEHLRRMMFDERRIALARFRSFFVSDPLRLPLVRGIIWGCFEHNRLQATFRVAEDGSFASIDDAHFAPLESLEVGPVHALQLSDAEREVWRTRLLDYELIPPFLQLEEAKPRSVAEVCALVTERRAGTQAIFALRGRGWRAHATGAGVDCLERGVGDARFVLSVQPPLTPKDTLHELVLTCFCEEAPSPVQLDSVAVDLARMFGDVS